MQHTPTEDCAEDVYCQECGEDEDLAYLAAYADSEEWKCDACGTVFLW